MAAPIDAKFLHKEKEILVSMMPFKKLAIRYTTMKSDGFNVKILVTVRDYAIQKVI